MAANIKQNVIEVCVLDTEAELQSLDIQKSGYLYNNIMYITKDTRKIFLRLNGVLEEFSAAGGGGTPGTTNYLDLVNKPTIGSDIITGDVEPFIQALIDNDVAKLTTYIDDEVNAVRVYVDNLTYTYTDLEDKPTLKSTPIIGDITSTIQGMITDVTDPIQNELDNISTDYNSLQNRPTIGSDIVTGDIKPIINTLISTQVNEIDVAYKAADKVLDDKIIALDNTLSSNITNLEADLRNYIDTNDQVGKDYTDTEVAKVIDITDTLDDKIDNSVTDINNDIDATVRPNLVKIGTVVRFSESQTIPTGYLKLDGAILNGSEAYFSVLPQGFKDRMKLDDSYTYTSSSDTDFSNITKDYYYIYIGA